MQGVPFNASHEQLELRKLEWPIQQMAEGNEKVRFSKWGDPSLAVGTTTTRHKDQGVISQYRSIASANEQGVKSTAVRHGP